MLKAYERNHPIYLAATSMTMVRKAIVVVDLVESVRLIFGNEESVIERWRAFCRQVVNSILPANSGRLVKSTGDGMMMVFSQANQAVVAAFQISEAIYGPNDRSHSTKTRGEDLRLRTAIHEGEIVEDELDIFGHAANVVSRMTAVAKPGEIVISQQIRDAIVDGLDGEIVDLGECFLKHLDEPLRTYKLSRSSDPSYPYISTQTLPQLEPTIAVIPFGSHQLASNLNAVGELISDLLTNRLSRTPALRVISHLSVRAFKDRSVGLNVISKKLNANYVLTGKCYGSGQNLQLLVELSEAQNETNIWADSISATLPDLFALDSQLVARIATQCLAAIVKTEVDRSVGAPLPTLQAYSLLLAASGLMHRSHRESFFLADKALEELEYRYPKASTPHAWRAKWCIQGVADGYLSDRSLMLLRSRTSAQRAIDISPENTLAIAIAGQVEAYLAKNLVAAEEHYKTALQGNPNESLAWLWQGTLESYKGNGVAAIDAVEKAIALSPLDPLKYYYYSLASTAALSANDFDKAIRYADISIRLNSHHGSTLRTMTIAQVLSGDLERARDSGLKLLKFEPTLTVEKYLARYPGSNNANAKKYAEALVAAGIPA